MHTRNSRDLDKKYGAMTLSRFIKSYRLTEGLNQAEMAERLGWTRGNLCDIENGRRSIGLERAIRMAGKLDFPLGYILEIIINEQFLKAGLKYEFKITKRSKAA